MMPVEGESRGEVVIPQGTRCVGAAAFRNAIELESVVIPGSVRVIECFAFAGCTNLKRVVFEDGADVIKHQAFAGCTSLESVRLPSTLKMLGYSAFDSCRALKDIVLPDGLRRIDNNAFQSCSSLKRINIPKELKRVGASFGTCAALEEIVVSKGMTWIPAVKFPGYVGRAVVVPENVVGLSDDVFGTANRLAIAPKACMGFCHLKYAPGGSREVADFLSEGERRLADERFDLADFCAWLQKVPKSVCAEGRSASETPLRLLECMRGHARILDVGACGTGSRFCLGALKYLLRSEGRPLVEKRRTFCRDLFAPPTRTGPAFLLGRRELMTHALATSFDEDWMSDVRPRRDWEKWSWSRANPFEFLEDDGLWAEMRKDSGAACLLRMGLLGIAVDADAIRKLFCCRTVNCILSAYRRFPELRTELPLEEVLLGVCGYWDVRSAMKFVREVERFEPGICARTRDGAGFSLLWYALYRKGRASMDWKSRDYGRGPSQGLVLHELAPESDDLPMGCEHKIGIEKNWRELAELLIEVGCDASESQPLGISIADAIEKNALDVQNRMRQTICEEGEIQ